MLIYRYLNLAADQLCRPNQLKMLILWGLGPGFSLSIIFPYCIIPLSLRGQIHKDLYSVYMSGGWKVTEKIGSVRKG